MKIITPYTPMAYLNPTSSKKCFGGKAIIKCTCIAADLSLIEKT